jgi:photosystem II stability/assembly factor-like uncharacterized protein
MTINRILSLKWQSSPTFRMRVLLFAGLIPIIFIVAALSTRTINTNRNSQQRTLSSSNNPDSSPIIQREFLTLTRQGAIPAENQLSNDTAHVQLQFIDELRGWISTGDRLWRTDDGGRDWRLAYGAEPGSITRFQFLTSEVGWLLASGKMYRTQNGGTSWELFIQPISTEGSGDLLTFQFLGDGQIGWVAGGLLYPVTAKSPPPTRYSSLDGTSGFKAAIFETTDSGKTWSQQSLISPWGLVHQLCVVDIRHAWLTGTAGTFYLVDTKWVPNRKLDVRALDTEMGMPSWGPNNFWFFDSRIGWLSNSNGWLAKTTDGGQTWRDIFRLHKRDSYDRQAFFEQINFSSTSSGIALDSTGEIYITHDGGTAWASQDLGQIALSFFFLDPTRGWLATNEGLYKLRVDAQSRR